MLPKLVKLTAICGKWENEDRYFETNETEIMSFIEISLVSGFYLDILTVPSSRVWSQQPNLGEPFISQAITCGRCQKLTAYVYLTDNGPLPVKIAKVGPLYKKLSLAWRVSINESTVLYFAKLWEQIPWNSWHYVQGPIRFLKKLLALCSSRG